MKFNLEELLFLQELFNNIKIKGRKARHLGRFIKAVSEHIETFQEEQIELLKEFAVLDEDGEIHLNKEGQAKFTTLADAEQYQLEVEGLILEKRVLSVDSYTEKTITNLLLEGEVEITGADAVLYDNICERLESGDESD